MSLEYFLQSMDPPERERVLINVDETSVRLVPEEGRGHVSKRAYRLFVSGKPMGRRASLAACRSTITHVAAICDKKMFSGCCPRLLCWIPMLVLREQVDWCTLAVPLCLISMRLSLSVSVCLSVDHCWEPTAPIIVLSFG